MQYEEYENQLVFREDSGAPVIVVLFIVFILFPCVMLSIVINIKVTFTCFFNDAI